MPKVETKVFKIPLWERYTELCHPAFKCKLMDINGIGLFVYHSEEHSYYVLTARVRRHWILRRRTHCIVEAEDEQTARTKFLNEWEGAQCGSRAPALWIDKDEKITQYPHCKDRYKNRKGEYTCGRPIHEIKGHEDQHDRHWNMNGEFGMCTIEGYDCPDWCPLIKNTTNEP